MRFRLRLVLIVISCFITSRLLLSYLFTLNIKTEENKQQFRPDLLTSVTSLRLDYHMNKTFNFTRNFTQESEEVYYKKRPFVVEPYIFDVIVEPRKLCFPGTFIVILVHSVHMKTAVRESIRATWGSVARKSNPSWPSVGPLNYIFSLFFVLGVHKDPGLNDMLIEENAKYGDIIIGNFYESYTNMTLKSLLGLKFLIQLCNSPKFLIKSDDDMFLNIPAIINLLKGSQHLRSIFGPLCVNSKVLRKGKWKLTKEEFPFDHFPPYYAGSAYIISSDLWKDLFELSFYVPRIHIDDVYITGILGEMLNATKVKKDGFAFWNSKAASVCELKSSEVLTSTKMNAVSLKETWKSLSISNNCSAA